PGVAICHAAAEADDGFAWTEEIHETSFSQGSLVAAFSYMNFGCIFRFGAGSLSPVLWPVRCSPAP
ncbi:MAG: hypothetical protein WBQ66_02875, partial [Blastocatellia bacterium]